MSDKNKDFLTSHGIKCTAQRILVLNILNELSAASTASTAEQIYGKAVSIQPHINLSTIYRILELFTSKKIITKHILSESKTAVYALNVHPHRHYMVCVECQSIIPLDDCPCEIIKDTIMKNTDFKMVDHKLEILGYCSKCNK